VRFAVLPLQKPASERSSSSSDAEEKDSEVQFKYLQGFLRFLETVNRIRRPPVTKVQVGSKCAPRLEHFLMLYETHC
jgi:hypothetical protein